MADSPNAPAPAGSESEAGPQSPQTVKKTRLVKSPREIDLEKKLSEAEDERDTLKARLSELENVLSGTPHKLKKGGNPQPPTVDPPPNPTERSIWDEVNEELGFNP